MAQFADDLSLLPDANQAEETANQMKPALEVVSLWIKENHVEISVEKTEAVLTSVDPSETAGKAKPGITLLGTPIDYKKEVTILGVGIDSQLRFSAQARGAATKLKKRIQILRVVAGKSWGPSAQDLRLLYKGYVRPGGLYAAEVCGSFLSDFSQDDLIACNKLAARVIVGAPAGSPAFPTKADARVNTNRRRGCRASASLRTFQERSPSAPFGRPWRKTTTRIQRGQPIQRRLQTHCEETTR